MNLNELISKLRGAQNYHLELRDEEGWSLFECHVLSSALKYYAECEVTEWFPGRAQGSSVDFVVYVKAPQENFADDTNVPYKPDDEEKRNEHETDH